ncbi:D-Ala-D-Ala carboxypeptidase family metallohydrolase [Aurantimonas sp. C2-6-R+9]|uniref:D-Ala-D-Ala carboxypeptidase family metallohydrolase n=1 Tax=unclassified Aurantimonas TaxID=2638230 RepID=UPI002E18068A|nr:MULTISPECIES: D-Ala-D-Ala carboxypeptidase family metallohydrolase [unclassified Aurantimonas]MEC5292833.1 D-Ala-D-Ala carboxypeptidase family metallohydrolase [Aurantimonas sp. C2-3-R2]MEC5383033.1 D-Ala-D-Ala carboxypeptidase family metallohydrolase [Aurantimonas sp. C2-6-R+9]MEC5413887.1 D-Ala-D-Ala carboxypeptidase family metallohydrolase [Aurantimonas sp. C2-4-R8]
MSRNRQAADQRPRARQAAALRDRLGKPLIVRSAYRSPEHNRVVGGATRSRHMDGAAFEDAAREVGFHPRSGFTHVDLGPERQ